MQDLYQQEDKSGYFQLHDAKDMEPGTYGCRKCWFQYFLVQIQEFEDKKMDI